MHLQGPPKAGARISWRLRRCGQAVPSHPLSRSASRASLQAALTTYTAAQRNIVAGDFTRVELAQVTDASFNAAGSHLAVRKSGLVKVYEVGSWGCVAYFRGNSRGQTPLQWGKQGTLGAFVDLPAQADPNLSIPHLCTGDLLSADAMQAIVIADLTWICGDIGRGLLDIFSCLCSPDLSKVFTSAVRDDTMVCKVLETQSGEVLWQQVYDEDVQDEDYTACTGLAWHPDNKTFFYCIRPFDCATSSRPSEVHRVTFAQGGTETLKLAFDDFLSAPDRFREPSLRVSPDGEWLVVILADVAGLDPSNEVVVLHMTGGMLNRTVSNAPILDLRWDWSGTQFACLVERTYEQRIGNSLCVVKPKSQEPLHTSSMQWSADCPSPLPELWKDGKPIEAAG
ncbi:hypothetical protein WJX73_010681 [Symbiochloris irregularis]|uniref:Uncharacterized protein n=1 Tax=Symbiochloris irregularis TaxID=706552 RepID=A0AAW1P1A3_9CHLO